MIDRHNYGLIYLFSLPRSGSTMLQKMLSSSAEVETLSEPWLMLHPLYMARKSGISTDYDHQLQLVAFDEFCRGAGVSTEDFHTAVREFSNFFYDRAMRGKSAHYFLDKTPRYWHVIDEIRAVHPDSKRVILLRHPLAILNSMVKTWFADSPGRFMASLQYKEDMLHGVSALARAVAARQNNELIVRYESLVTKPHEEMARLCEFLSIPYSESLVDYGEAGRGKWRFGDQENVYANRSPRDEYQSLWRRELKQPRYDVVVRDFMAHTRAEDIEVLGYSYAEMQEWLGDAGGADRRASSSMTGTRLDSGGMERISVVIANRNKAAYLGRCLESVLSQTYDNLEIIIVDDSSTDDSVRLIESYMAAHPGRIVLHKNMRQLGVAASRNLGFELATGALGTTLDSDDFYCSAEKLQREHQLLKSLKGEGRHVAYSDVIRVDEHGRTTGRLNPDVRDGALFESFLCRECFIPRDFLCALELYRDLKFDPGYMIYEDWDFKLRLARAVTFHGTGQDGVAYRKLRDGLSRQAYDAQAAVMQQIFDSHIGHIDLESRGEVSRRFRRHLQGLEISMTGQLPESLQEWLGGKSIVLFGASGSGRRMLQLLRRLGLEAEHFIDNDPSKHGSVVEGVPVIAAPQMSSLDNSHILVCSSFWPQIRTQLVDLGYVEDEDFSIAPVFDCNA